MQNNLRNSYGIYAMQSTVLYACVRHSLHLTADIRSCTCTLKSIQSVITDQGNHSTARRSGSLFRSRSSDRWQQNQLTSEPGRASCLPKGTAGNVHMTTPLYNREAIQTCLDYTRMNTCHNCSVSVPITAAVHSCTSQ